MKLLSAQQVRQWDQYTIQHQQITSWQLMERAAMACTQWLINNAFTQQPIKIFCGKGNNGGDGLAIACQLAEQNIIAEVFILEFGAVGTPDFQQNLNRLHQLPVNISFVQDAAFLPVIEPGNIVIDALYGSGVNRPLEGLSAQLVQHINQTASTIISIDIPSGMMLDQDTVPNPMIHATHTLTFQVLKLCFLMAENEPYFGQVHILPIGLLPQFLEDVESAIETITIEQIKSIYKPRLQFQHKGSFGHALLIAGETGKLGAAILATKACLRSGVGLVSTLLNEEHASVLHAAVPEAMVVFRNNKLDFTKYASIGLGPGLGTGDRAIRLIQHTLQQQQNIVIDADGLNTLAGMGNYNLGERFILTPHPKEFDRLFGSSNNGFERLKKAIENAAVHKCIIVLKGHHTAVVLPTGKVYMNMTGNAGMATAGSGDVLTGIITGLLAQGYSPIHAAILGVYLHGLSGDIAARKHSQEAMIAGDITRYLGEAFKRINSGNF